MNSSLKTFHAAVVRRARGIAALCTAVFCFILNGRLAATPAVMSPAGGEHAAAGDSMPLRWSAPGFGPTVSLRLWNGAQGTSEMLANDVPVDSAGEGTLSWLVPAGLESDMLRLEVVNQGQAGGCIFSPTFFKASSEGGLGKNGSSRSVGRAGNVAILPNPIDLRFYPNPFSGGFRVVYTVPADDGDAPVDLLIIDEAGRTVARLVHDMKSSGRHTVEASAASFGLRPGTYILAAHMQHHMQSIAISLVR